MINYRSDFVRLTALSLPLIFLLIVAFPRYALSWTKEVIEAANAVANGTATPKQEAIAFQNNKAINEMALKGEIPKDVYHANQSSFEKLNNRFVSEAAVENGLTARLQQTPPDKISQPGTDTDVLVEKGTSGKPITSEQVANTTKSYNRKVEQFLKDSGVPTSGNQNWARKTDTDFMPVPSHTTPKEFAKIAAETNKHGGTMYKDPKAAEVEAQMRSGKKIEIKDANAYVKEMQTLANDKLHHANELDRQARDIRRTSPQNETQAKSLEAEAQLKRSQAGKYIERIDKVGGKLAEQHGMGASKPQGPAAESVSAVSKTRGPETARQAANVGTLGEHSLTKSTHSYAENLAKIGKANPELAKAAQAGIAKTAANLSPNQKGQLIEHLRNVHGDEFAKGVAKEMVTKVPNETSSRKLAAEPSAKGQVAESPKGKGRIADTPDGGLRTPTHAPEGRVGKVGKVALDKVGKGMMAVDIFSGAQDFKEAAKKGDVEGMKKATVETADSLTGGIMGTKDTLGAKIRSAVEGGQAQSAINQANRMNEESHNQRVAIELGKAGVGKAEIQRILDAKAKGDDSPMNSKFAAIGKPVPTRIVEKDVIKFTGQGVEIVGGDDTWKDRAEEVKKGMVERVEKAGKFLHETKQDLKEIGTGLLEKDTRDAVIEQVKENLSRDNIRTGFEARDISNKADADRAVNQERLVNKFVEKGASRDAAEKAVREWEKGDRRAFNELKESLKQETGTDKREADKEGDKTGQTVRRGKGRDHASKEPQDKLGKETGTDKREAGKEKEKTQAERPKSNKVVVTKGPAEKGWKSMTSKERRDALTANKDVAWEKVKGALLGDPKAAKEVIEAIDSKKGGVSGDTYDPRRDANFEPRDTDGGAFDVAQADMVGKEFQQSYKNAHRSATTQPTQNVMKQPESYTTDPGAKPDAPGDTAQTPYPPYPSGYSSDSTQSSPRIPWQGLAGGATAGSAAARGGAIGSPWKGASASAAAESTAAGGRHPFQGRMTGSWRGGCTGETIKGSFAVSINANGEVKGSYSGDDSGGLQGRVTQGGSFTASGSGSGGASWMGQVREAGGGTIAGNGSWSWKKCTGSWQSS